MPVRFEGVGELTTPTGAALLKVLAHDRPPAGLHRGAGGLRRGDQGLPDRPNVLRASLGRAEDAGAEGSGWWRPTWTTARRSCSGYLVERLLAVGALDAWVAAGDDEEEPARAPAGRAGGGRRKREAVMDALLRESTTLGVRYHRVERHALERDWVEVETPWGKVRVKRGLRGGAGAQRAPGVRGLPPGGRGRRACRVKQVMAAALAALTP